MKTFRIISKLSLAILLSTTIAYCMEGDTVNVLQMLTENGDPSAVLNIIQQQTELQKAIATLSTVKLDPAVKKELEDNIAALKAKAQKNINEDLKDIKVAAGLSSLLEATDKMANQIKMEGLHTHLKDLKYSARSNTIHKLVMGIIPGEFAKTKYYQGSYTETIGFTANDYVINKIMNLLGKTSFVKTLTHMTNYDQLPDNTRHWTQKVLAGVIAHFAWNLEKGLLNNAISAR